MFVSELKVIEGAVNSGEYLAVAIFLLLLVIVFIGMARIVLRMSQGAATVPADDAATAPAQAEPWAAVLPPAVLCAAVLVLGLYLPSGVTEAIARALAQVGIQ